MSWNKWWGNLFKKKVKPKQIEKPKTVETAKPKPKLERIKPKPKLDTVPLFPTTGRRCGELDYLHPALRIGVITALEHCHQEGLMIYVFESYRTPARQQKLFDKGRNTPGRKVTNARPFQSFHNYGLAFDLVFDGARVGRSVEPVVVKHGIATLSHNPDVMLHVKLAQRIVEDVEPLIQVWILVRIRRVAAAQSPDDLAGPEIESADVLIAVDDDLRTIFPHVNRGRGPRRTAHF